MVERAGLGAVERTSVCCRVLCDGTSKRYAAPGLPSREVPAAGYGRASTSHSLFSARLTHGPPVGITVENVRILLCSWRHNMHASSPSRRSNPKGSEQDGEAEVARLAPEPPDRRVEMRAGQALRFRVSRVSPRGSRAVFCSLGVPFTEHLRGFSKSFLSCTALPGKVPPELWELGCLEHMWLQGNQLSGESLNGTEIGKANVSTPDVSHVQEMCFGAHSLNICRYLKTKRPDGPIRPCLLTCSRCHFLTISRRCTD